MKLEITYNPKSGYSIYYINSHGERSFHGTVSTQDQANRVFEQERDDDRYRYWPLEDPVEYHESFAR
jgi:hypothetical protein